MEPYNHWEDFENGDSYEYESMDDDQAYDREFDEEFKRRFRKYKKQRLSKQELFGELSKFIGLFQSLEASKRTDWYVRFCEAMARGDKKYYVEVTDIDVLEAAQEVATEGPNGESYDEWIQEFAYREEPDNYSEIEFLKVLDTMGYFKDKLDLINNPQDILDL
tara:strand:+ start:916 stop:1404 length:489 start_codon:yes stop_codon:yes gene_type:complete